MGRLMKIADEFKAAQPWVEPTSFFSEGTQREKAAPFGGTRSR